MLKDIMQEKPNIHILFHRLSFTKIYEMLIFLSDQMKMSSSLLVFHLPFENKYDIAFEHKYKNGNSSKVNT